MIDSVCFYYIAPFYFFFYHLKDCFQDPPQKSKIAVQKLFIGTYLNSLQYNHIKFFR